MNIEEQNLFENTKCTEWFRKHFEFNCGLCDRRIKYIKYFTK